MKVSLITILLLITFYVYPQDNPEFPQIALTNNVKFNDSQFNNPLAGCAFLLEFGENLYAITCKHALWVAKSDKMKGIHFENTLKEWRMQVKNDSTNYIITDKLLNEDRNEAIGEINVQTDYLVFTIRENNSTVKPLKLRNTPLQVGEYLYSIGWSFQDKEGAQRTYKYKLHKELDKKILIETIGTKPGPGISGSALIDKNGQLVGIISDYAKDPVTKEWYLAPCNTKYLKEILIRLKQNK